jgi:hypothetical protein
MLLETWILGAVLVLVGLLVIGCGIGKSELGIPFLTAGLASTAAGSLLFLTGFKKWIESC